MSHKHHFQCFQCVNGDGTQRSFNYCRHHESRFPRIPQHGMAGYYNPHEDCCLCSECRHVQALEPLYHAPCYLHHPLHIPRRPEQPPEGQPGQDHHIYHRRHHKRVVLVKNSDPSCRKTIVLHRRGLHSLGLFLEEASELMEYPIRKMYTLEGHKIESVQGLMQCPSVLVCVGQEPTHPRFEDIFPEISDDRLPNLEKTQMEDSYDAKSQVDSASSPVKSLPDGTESPEMLPAVPTHKTD
ncbi:hypothetical protein WMY93_015479 [Mugilogobius chulae]|uniref:Doublecortin domain-containing protein n=1 Tax=Mugilogobius chulae TaxID=88201 RepID=A0AAW0NRB1_9GOBI